jgi:hypothetical protein
MALFTGARMLEHCWNRAKQCKILQRSDGVADERLHFICRWHVSGSDVSYGMSCARKRALHGAIKPAMALYTWFLLSVSLVPPAADRIDRERKLAVIDGCQKNQGKP